MARRILLPALLMALFALTACPGKPKYPACKTDEHCKEQNEVCFEGQCKECGTDANCKEGFMCRDNKCVPKAECAQDGDCPAGFRCRDEKCQPECTAAADCAKGQVCREGRCQAAECLSDADCPSGKKCDSSGSCNAVSVSECGVGSVYFEFNESSLTADARRSLDRAADCLKAVGALTVAGHCDERGTEEYNLHLGERRAASVKKYLTALGLDGGKVRTISYGEERPADPGHDEASWAKNRRVEISQ